MNEDQVAGRLRAMLRADVGARALRPLREYQRIFSGFDAVVAREYERIASSAGIATPASPAPAPPRSTPICDGPVATPSAGTGSCSNAAIRATLERMEDQGRERPESLGEIAHSSMSTIHRVRDPLLRRELAMKLLGQDPRLRPDLLQRFLDEAQITAQLDHPGVVGVHRLALDTDGRPFFTMKFVRGRTLDRVLAAAREEREGWTLHRAVQVLLRVCETLAYAHSKGVIHRDLKPDNVMVGNFGEVYVMDWGLAKVLRRSAGDRADDGADATGGAGGAGEVGEGPVTTDRSEALYQSGETGNLSIGIVIGTPNYMSPEQALGKNDELDERTDVYAVGGLLYELLAGHAPYAVPGVRKVGLEILRDVINGPPAPLSQAAPGGPVGLRRIVDVAMARAREDRYASAAELAEDLQHWLEGRPVVGRGTV